MFNLHVQIPVESREAFRDLYDHYCSTLIEVGIFTAFSLNFIQMGIFVWIREIEAPCLVTVSYEMVKQVLNK